MNTITETILTSATEILLEHCRDLEKKLAELQREFDIVEGACDFWKEESDRKDYEFDDVLLKLHQLESSDRDAAFWKEESDRKQEVINKLCDRDRNRGVI